MVGAAIKTPNPPPPPPQKPRPLQPQREPGSAPRRPGRPPLVIRIAVSVFILWHFTGVFLAALSVPTSSELVMNVAQHWMQWYLDALYMNQGHSFFAPDVGPGHLIKYQLYDQSGREMEHGELPSRKEHWPRLLYHRYFMLADQSELPFDDKPTRDYWQRKYLEAYGRHLLSVNENAQSVRLQRYAHWPPPKRFFVKDPKSTDNTPIDSKTILTDPKGYELLMDVTQRRSDLAPPPANQTMNWQQGRADTARRWMGAPR